MKPAVRAALVPVLAGIVIGTAAGKTPTRIAIQSGTQQSAHAWALSNANFYETAFNQALSVKVSPDATIRFRCLTRACTFPPSDQPDNVTRVDPSAFDVGSANGIASIKLTVRTVTPGTIVVIAGPADNARTPGVRFTLIAR